MFVAPKYVTYSRTSIEVTLEIDPPHLFHRVDEISSWLIPKGEDCEKYRDRDPLKLKNVTHRSLGNCEKGLCLVQFPFTGNVSKRVDTQRCIQISFQHISQKDEFFLLPRTSITGN